MRLLNWLLPAACMTANLCFSPAAEAHDGLGLRSYASRGGLVNSQSANSADSRIGVVPARLTSDSADETNASVIQLAGAELLMAYDYDWQSSTQRISRRVLRRSTDGGMTWSTPESVAGAYRSMPKLLQTRDLGVWLFYEEQTNEHASRICYRQSSDDGHVWSDETILQTDSNQVLDICPLQADNGTVFVFYDVHTNFGGVLNYAVFYQTSTDNGSTWSGDLVLNSHSSYDVTGSTVEDSTDRLWLLCSNWYETSTDYGVTWSSRRQFPRIPGGAIVRAVVDSAGRVIVAYSVDTWGIGSWTIDIFYIVSSDNGATWSDSTRLTRYVGNDHPDALTMVGAEPWLFFHSDRWANNDIYSAPLLTLSDSAPPPWLRRTDAQPVPYLKRPFAPLGYCEDDAGISAVYLVYAVDGQPQSDLQLFDDGAHGDRNSNDHWFGNIIPAFNTDRQVRVSCRYRISDNDGNVVLAPLHPWEFSACDIHDTGNLGLYIEPKDGRDGPNAMWRNESVPSCEWPLGSGNQYLFDGQAWVGAVIQGETLVSGCDFNSGKNDWAQCPTDTMFWRPGASDKDSRVRFDDRQPTWGRPLGIQVTKRCLSWHRSCYADFIIQEYTFRNTGTNGALTGVYIGFAYDFDVQVSSDDWSGFDSTRSLAYVFDFNSPVHIGMSMLSRAPTSYTYWDWSTEAVSDEQRYRWLASDSFMANSNQSGDQRVMQSVGPFDLSVGDSLKTVVGLVAGDSLTGIQQNTDTMRALYSRGYVVGTRESGPASERLEFKLDPATPSPMCDRASICYQLAEENRTSLRIYGLDGRLVRTLVEGTQKPGTYRALWTRRDVRGMTVSQGIYFCRLQSGQSRLTRKLVVVN